MPETFYCELQDVIGVGVTMQKLIQLTDGTETYNQEIFNTARSAATAQINGFAMTKHSEKIPFNPVPAAIRTIAAILTKYYLYQRKNAVTEDIQKAYENQIYLLTKLQNGTFKLEQDNAIVSEDSVDYTNKKPEDRYFHPDNMQGYLP